MSYTVKSKVIITNWKGLIKKSYKIKYDTENFRGNYDPAHAKPNWNRVLTFTDDKIIAGTPPASVNIIDIKTGQVKLIRSDSDDRNAFHGLEILPMQLFNRAQLL